MRLAIPWLLVGLLTACGDDDTTPPGRDSGAGGTCAVDSDCDDGVFCNGTERCDPVSPLAGASGCVLSERGPCPPGDSCDEAGSTCGMGCPDLDGDGSPAAACGGSDCDDADPARFGGNPEVCDDSGVDEDCDETTVGARDADGDGAVDAACCNGSTCGTDCDDSQGDVHPGESEACDSKDNDCDGTVDEAAGMTCWADVDEDGFAPTGAATTIACDCAAIGGHTNLEPLGSNRDCNDMEPTAFPGQTMFFDAPHAPPPPFRGTTFDYDCDGVEETRHPSPAPCGGMRSCTATAGFRFPGVGCGQSGAFYNTSLCMPGSGGCVWTGSGTSIVQPCR